MTFFRKKFPFSRPKKYDDFLNFASLFRIFPHKKNNFFYSFHNFAHIRQHYFAKYWGDECIGRPPTSNFGGTVPPSPLGFRSCTADDLMQITQMADIV